MLNRLLTTILLFVLCSCGGGSRGTGDLTLSGSAVSTTGEPVVNATVTVSATGDSATTDAQGQFTIHTTPFAGSVELVLEIQGQEIISRGGDITEDVEEAVVNVRVNLRKQKPEAEQEVEIRKRRHGKNEDSNSSGGNTDEPSPSPTPSPPSGDDSASKNRNDSKNDGGKSSGKNDQSQDGGSGEDSGDSSDDEKDSGKGEDSNSGGATPSPTPTPEEHSGDSSDERISLRGKISELGSNYLSLNGYQIFVDQHTDFDKRHSLSEFHVGEQIEVKATYREQRWLASEVRLRN